jgi:RNA polymerase sigma-70 factor (ECF subfamily)
VGDELFQTITDRARARWPGVTLDPTRFRERLLECAARPDASPEEVLPSLHTDDIYLACACAAGDVPALELFDAQLLTRVGDFVARVGRAPQFVDEVRQRLREALLVGRSGGRPGIAAFSGRGALASWVNVAALRTALDLRKREGDVREASEDDAVWAESHPELGYIKEHYRSDFRAIFQSVLASLPSPERRLLRMHFVDGLSMSQIGAIEKLDKSNVSRRLQAIRATVLQKTREGLQQRLGIDEAELDSLIGVMHSQLDVSLERFLGQTHE